MPQDFNEIAFKVDRRLKSARLYRGVDGSVEVRSPSTLSKRSISKIINQIESGTIKLPPAPSSLKYPNSIHTPITGKTFKISYVTRADSIRKVEINQESVSIVAPSPAELSLCLGDLLKRISRDPLSNLLKSHLDRLGYEARTIRIGLPKGRWASRSSTGTISLNARLILLKSHLVEGVILHEISHIAHMNHSKEFYRHLEELDPNYRERRNEINAAQANFEPWVRSIR
ncbi:MAG: DUF45 domain-containing protein [Actinomycetota bacterium]|nr:DUF45 domain-containing protein [Actinomycetota bacterium]